MQFITLVDCGQVLLTGNLGEKTLLTTNPSHAIAKALFQFNCCQCYLWIYFGINDLVF